MRQNITIALEYIQAWLQGHGAVALYNLMEDTATAEISRAQLWQWVHQKGAVLADGRSITIQLFREMVVQELEKIAIEYGDARFDVEMFELARALLDELVINEHFEEFLTLPAYKYLR